MMSAVKYQTQLALKVREARAQCGMTRKDLALASGVSLRFLVQIETGTGNPSLRILHQLAASLAVPLEALVAVDQPNSVEKVLLLQLLTNLNEEQLAAARALLAGRFSPSNRTQGAPIALIGLRGAGKSTLGRRLAKSMRIRFVEIDRQLEKRLGASIGEVIQFYGHAGYRRHERTVLLETLERNTRCVIEPGGGLVTDPETLQLILGRTRAVWLRASPEDHMRRVLDQGDFRPMGNSRAAMRELRGILKAREPFYRQAPIQVDTSGRTVEQSLRELMERVGPV
jgi:XRE family aerobic/anaerobic benzoate catabolism transcriptional regulator